MKTVRDRQTYVLTISVKVQTTPFNRECRYDKKKCRVGKVNRCSVYRLLRKAFDPVPHKELL